MSALFRSAPGADADTADPVDVGGSGVRAQLSRMKLESLILTACYGLTALVGVAFWAFAARSVPVERLGLSTAVISAFTAAAAIGATGIANGFLAMIPIAGRAQGALLRLGYGAVVASCAVTGTAAGFIAAFTVPDIGSRVTTVVGIAAISVMWGVFVTQDSVLIALGKARWLLAENIPFSMLKLVTLPLFAAAVGTGGGHPVVLATVIPALLGVLAVSGFAVPYLIRRTRAAQPPDPGGTVAAAWMREHRRGFGLFALRDGTASALSLGLFMFLPFLVTAAAGPTQGAVFALSLQVSNAMDLFTVGVSVSLTTTAASDHASAPAAARAMWKRLARIVAVVAVVVIAGAPLLLWVFGATYLHHGGWAVVAILALGALCRTMFEVWCALLRGLRHTLTLLVWSAVAAVTLFAGVVAGASLGGAIGAAVGVSAATVVSGAIGGLGLLGRLGRLGRLDRPAAGVSDLVDSGVAEVTEVAR